MKKVLSAVIFAALVMGINLQVRAETAGGEGDTDKTLSPYFFIEKGDPSTDRLPLKATDVSVHISGVIAAVTVRQSYENAGKNPINARYVFPASTRAALHGMTMKVGDSVIRARTKERSEAKKEYEEAKRDGKSASLLEQERPNVFTMNVANIKPGDRVEIEMEYTELLVPVDGTYAFVYPTVAGPRYCSQEGKAKTAGEGWLHTPYFRKGRTPETSFNISLGIQAGMPLNNLSCGSHDVVIRRDGESKARVSLRDPAVFSGNRDFIVRYGLRDRAIETGLLLYRGGDENFFLLMAQPPERVEKQDIPPREYVFIIDVSGSMHGFPLDTTKELLRKLIGSLRPGEKFNVILFSGDSRIMAPASLDASKENIDRAMEIIDGQEGGGGTELLAALRVAMAMPGEKGMSRSLLVITDGYISAEHDVFELIDASRASDNVFAFGIGSSVNRHLIEGIARAGGGEPFIVTDSETAVYQAERFRTYVDSPVLTDVSVAFQGFDAYDVEPLFLPDLFSSRPLVIFGKWRGKPAGQVLFRGMGGSAPFEKMVDVGAVEMVDTAGALKYLWARKRIERLSDFAPARDEEKNRCEIIALGLRYNLLTKYTSFIAVLDAVRNASGKARDVDQPVSLPEGVSEYAIGAGMNNTPEPGLCILFALGAVLFILARRGIGRFRAGESSVGTGGTV